MVLILCHQRVQPQHWTTKTGGGFSNATSVCRTTASQDWLLDLEFGRTNSRGKGQDVVWILFRSDPFNIYRNLKKHLKVEPKGVFFFFRFGFE